MDPNIADLLDGFPSNWGRWGSDDELGALNYLTSDRVLRGIEAVEHGEVFALGTPLDHPGGDPVATGVTPPEHDTTLDVGDVRDGSVDPDELSGMAYSADTISMPVHGVTTHVDAPGHVWYEDELYNGFDAATTEGGLDRCGIEQAGDHGIVGRGVLLDVAGHRGVDHLGRGERISVAELRACADAQGTDIEEGDVLLIRTGAMDHFYRDGPEAFFDTYRESDGADAFENEPGPTLDRDLVDWIHERSIPLLATDTIHGEQTVSSTTGTKTPLHPALLRDLGVYISELHLLGDLASHCNSTDRWTFCYVAAPLKIVGGTGSPVNPLAIT